LLLKSKPLLKSLKKGKKQKHLSYKKQLMLLIKLEEMKPRESLNLPRKTEKQDKKWRMKEKKPKKHNSKLRTKRRMQRLS